MPWAMGLQALQTWLFGLSQSFIHLLQGQGCGIRHSVQHIAELPALHVNTEYGDNGSEEQQQEGRRRNSPAQADVVATATLDVGLEFMNIGIPLINGLQAAGCDGLVGWPYGVSLHQMCTSIGLRRCVGKHGDAPQTHATLKSLRVYIKNSCRQGELTKALAVMEGEVGDVAELMWQPYALEVHTTLKGSA